jgi:hypothetical protein
MSIQIHPSNNQPSMRIVVIEVSKICSSPAKRTVLEAPMADFFAPRTDQPSGSRHFGDVVATTLGPNDQAGADAFAATFLSQQPIELSRAISLHNETTVELYHTPTSKDLYQILEACDDVPILLILSCPVQTGNIYVSDAGRELGMAVDGDRLGRLLEDFVGKLKLTVLCTDYSTLLAPALQVAKVPTAVTFSHGKLDVDCAQVFVEQLLGAVVATGSLHDAQLMAQYLKATLWQQMPGLLVTHTPPAAQLPDKLRIVLVSATPSKNADGTPMEEPPASWPNIFASLKCQVALTMAKNARQAIPQTTDVAVDVVNGASIADLESALARDPHVPTILMLACRQTANERSLTFAQRGDCEVADVVATEDVLQLISRPLLCNLQCLVFLASYANRYAGNYQSSAIRHFVTFSTEKISAPALLPVLSTLIPSIAFNAHRKSLFVLIQEALAKALKCSRLFGEPLGIEAVKNALQTVTL